MEDDWLPLECLYWPGVFAEQWADTPGNNQITPRNLTEPRSWSHFEVKYCPGGRATKRMWKAEKVKSFCSELAPRQTLTGKSLNQEKENKCSPTQIKEDFKTKGFKVCESYEEGRCRGSLESLWGRNVSLANSKSRSPARLALNAGELLFVYSCIYQNLPYWAQSKQSRQS